ncbi:hypothetical protein DAMA08_034870 [Martiniozyma asiatica (nom. inval.)]|nr:hypothetical protein DAMA08_034870 [Martiniozyma asiatica]
MLSMIPTILLSSMISETTSNTLRVQLSSIFGSISFACWLVLMIPQLVEQWRLKTVEGISPLFLLMWALGDVANFIGSFWGNLLPEVLLIAAWFLFADILTLGFYLYIKIIYDKKRKSHQRHLLHQHHVHTQERGLVNDNEAQYGAIADDHDHEHEHEHEHQHHNRKRRSSIVEDIVYEPENHSIFVKYIVPIGFVIFAGVFGSILSPNGPHDNIEIKSTNNQLGPQICGYISAFLYLTARLPQIYHNWSKKSTSGLSLLFFILTMLGNITYSLQIITFRNDWEYIMLNMSWLLGSAGTILQDTLILIQFWLYK